MLGNKDEPLLNKGDGSPPVARAVEGGEVAEEAAGNGTMETIAGVMGNVLEWYDFALFGFFSDIIAKVFFAPSEDNLLRSFAVYGGAFLMRPVGGLTIGYIGDRYGRKEALVLSLFLMAVPTFLMGCLPTHERVGSMSTVLLVLCRLLQGMSVGGQLPASLIYTVEMRPRAHWGYYGSLVMMAANVGTLLGNLVGAVLRTVLTEEELVAWGWRIPFWSGLLIALVAVYLKLYGREHNPNADRYDGESKCDRGEVESTKHPLKDMFKRDNLPALCAATLTPMLWGAGFYTSFVWMAIFMEVLIEPPIEHGFWVNAAALLFGIILPLPLAGSMSDRYGRDKTMLFGAAGLAVVGPIMLRVISSSGGALSAFLGQWTLGIFLSLFGGPMNAWLVEKFPASVRLTSASFGYDLAHCTASAFSPMIATLLVQDHGNNAPGALYPIFAVVAVLGMFISTKIHRDGCIDESDSSVEMAHKDEGGTIC